MKKNEKIFVAIIAIVAVLIIVGMLVSRNAKRNKMEANTDTGDLDNYIEEEFVQRLDDGTRLNTSEQMGTAKKIDNIDITDIQVTEKNNISLILGTATNNSSTTFNGCTLDVKVVDKNGDEIITIGAMIGRLEPGQSQQFNTSATFDFANAYDFIVTKREDLTD